MNPRNTTIFISFTLASALALSGCASSSGQSGANASAGPSQQRMSGEAETAPIASDRVVLRVNGMSCPKCANNIDKQLAGLPGVSRSAIDMGAGEVTVYFGKGTHPSRAELRGAIERTGFTLVSINEPATVLPR